MFGPGETYTMAEKRRNSQLIQEGELARRKMEQEAETAHSSGRWADDLQVLRPAVGDKIQHVNIKM